MSGRVKSCLNLASFSLFFQFGKSEIVLKSKILLKSKNYCNIKICKKHMRFKLPQPAQIFDFVSKQESSVQNLNTNDLLPHSFIFLRTLPCLCRHPIYDFFPLQNGHSHYRFLVLEFLVMLAFLQKFCQLLLGSYCLFEIFGLIFTYTYRMIAFFYFLLHEK